MDALCSRLAADYQDLTSIILKLGETNGPLADLVEGRLHQLEPKLGQLFQHSRIAFEPIRLLDDEAMVLLLQKVDWDRLSLVMKGAAEMVQEQFFRNMNPKAVDLLQKFTECDGPSSLAEIQEAQEDVLAALCDLLRAGDIRFG